MKRKSILTSITIQLCVTVALGIEQDNCSPVDLRTPELGSPMKQGSSYWCYAFTAADLITQATGKKVSPIDIALTNIKDRSIWDSMNGLVGFGDVAKGGNIQKSINRLKGQVCSYDDMPAGLKQIEAGIEIIEKTNKMRSLPASTRYSCEKEDLDTLSLLFPNSNITDLFTAISKESIDEGVDALKNQGCSDRKIHFPDFPWVVEAKSETNDQPELIKQLDDQLTNGRIVAIQYDPNFILKPEYRSTRLFVDLFARKRKHASTVVARRFFNGKCQYLIRGSSGPSCKIFETDRCDKNDPGNIWVSFEELAKNTAGITYLKSPKSE